MVNIGYKLSSEEHSPNDLIQYARQAEAAGFTFAMISDHYHPWTDRQGQSSFVWSVIGGVAAVTGRLRLGTAVSCPTIRMHPAIIAQAAATATAMMPGRFMFGVGTGESLNEHILGNYWPSTKVRRAMLEEAIEVIRLLWQGGLRNYTGRYYIVENARLYTLPDEPPPILIAAGGQQVAELAGHIGDGLITVGGEPEPVKIFTAAGGAGKPCYTELTVCWSRTDVEARKRAHEQWPIAGLPPALLSDLRLPAYFEQAADLVREEEIAKTIVCGPDPERHITAIKRCLAAGYTHVWLHQVGPEQDGFFRFYEREVLPHIR